jgi:hypothetical protein
LHELFDSVKPDTWNNIPVCLVKSLTVLLDALTQLTARHLEDDESHFDRHFRLKKRVNDIERRLEEREKVMQKQMDVNIKKLEDRQQKTIEQLSAEVKDLQWRMEELKRKCENDM